MSTQGSTDGGSLSPGPPLTEAALVLDHHFSWRLQDAHEIVTYLAQSYFYVPKMLTRVELLASLTLSRLRACDALHVLCGRR